MLWFEWRCFLRKHGIDSANVLTPHMFFHTWLTPAEDGQTIAQVVIAPFALVDQDRSAVLFDPRLRVIVVRDATDYAKPVTTTPETPDQLLERLLNEGQVWDHLLMLATQPGTTEEVFTSELRKALRGSPAPIMRRILIALLESRSRVDEELANQENDDEADMSSDYAELEENLISAEQVVAVAREMRRAIRASNFGSFQTARQSLTVIEDQRGWIIRVRLLRAIVECRAQGLSFEKELPAMFHQHRRLVPNEIRVPFQQARDVDAEYVKAWINHLEDRGPTEALGKLLHGLPQAREHCTADQFAALVAQGAVESARLARELEQAAATLAEERETVDTALAKLGLGLERAILSDVAGTLHEDLTYLVEVLIGKELPGYKGEAHER